MCRCLGAGKADVVNRCHQQIFYSGWNSTTHEVLLPLIDALQVQATHDLSLLLFEKAAGAMHLEGGSHAQRCPRCSLSAVRSFVHESQKNMLAVVMLLKQLEKSGYPSS